MERLMETTLQYDEKNNSHRSSHSKHSNNSKSSFDKKKIVFVTGSSGREELMVKVSQELTKRHDSRGYFLSLAPGNVASFLTSRGIDKNNVFQLAPLSTTIENPDVDYIRRSEDRYDFRVFDIWQLTALRDKSREKIPEKDIFRYMEFIIRGTEKIIQELQPDYVFMMDISGYSYVLVYKIFLAHRIPVLELINPRIPGRFTFDNAFRSEWPLLVKNYASIKEDGMTKDDQEEAKKLIKSFTDAPFKPDDSTTVKEPLSVKLSRVKMDMQRLAHRRRLPHLAPFFWHPLKDKLLKGSSRFEQPLEHEKYVFFPLQVFPEASTSIRGKWYVDQVSLIDNLVKAIPCDYKLYVKEHPKNFSIRPAGFHRSIKKHQNVRLISPFANTVQMIKDSSLVITITGTVGWEAVLLQKPVLTFGEVFYNIFDEVKKVESIEKLPELVCSSLGRMVDYDKTVKFVAAVLKATYPGIGALPGDCQHRSLTDENITKLVDGLERYAGEMMTLPLKKGSSLADTTYERLFHQIPSNIHSKIPSKISSNIP